MRKRLGRGSPAGGPPAPPTQNQYFTGFGGAGIQPNVTWFSQDCESCTNCGADPPGPRGSPWTRFSPTESASSAQGKPTRASAADQGVRPTINADCPILTKPRDIGHSACHDVFPHPVRLEHERCDPCGYARQPLGPVEPVSGCRVSSARD